MTKPAKLFKNKSSAAVESEHFRATRKANKISTGRRGIVFGVGINDADYVVGSKVNKRCQAYILWKEVMARCYSPLKIKKCPTYAGCSVSTLWHSFMNFREWWLQNHVDGWQLDKDLLVYGNRVYGPETCVFVPSHINSFLIDARAARGEWPIGVAFHVGVGKFISQCRDHQGKNTHLGCFSGPESAHHEWRRFKLMILERLRPEMDKIDCRIYFTAQKTILEAK